MSNILSPSKSNQITSTESKRTKRVLVEYLFLDLQVCDRCVGTEQVLEEVVTGLTPALRLAGYQVEYQKIKMDTSGLAQQYRFESSPTVRVNGRDVCLNIQESNCGCCSDISGTQVDCRVFEYEGQSYEVPPKEMLAEAILQVMFGTAETHLPSTHVYDLPRNLEVFYKGKNEKVNCNCTSGCC